MWIGGSSDAAIRRTAQKLREARYPLILAGGGGARSAGGDLLLELAQTLRAPVLTSISGKGAIPDSSPWSAGCTWRTSSGPTDGYPDAWRKGDAGLVVGSRLTGMSTRAWRLPLPGWLAHLDLDEGEMGKSYPVQERLVGDAAVGVRRLLESPIPPRPDVPLGPKLHAFLGPGVLPGWEVVLMNVAPAAGTAIAVDLTVRGERRRILVEPVREDGEWRVANIWYREGEDYVSFHRRLRGQ